MEKTEANCGLPMAGPQASAGGNPNKKGAEWWIL